MGTWFGNQLKKRLRSDQNLFSDSLSNVGDIIVGSRVLEMNQESMLRITMNAISELLHVFHLDPDDWPERLTEPEEILDYFMTPAGIMQRKVELTDDWYHHAIGIYLASTKDGRLIVLMPRRGHYEYLDHATGMTVRVTARNAADISHEATCFYRPLPQRPLTVRDLLAFTFKELSVYDYLAITLIILSLIGLSMFTPVVTRYLLSQVIYADNLAPLISVGFLLITVSVSTMLMTIAREIAMNKILIKTDVSIRAAVMMRLISLPATFFRGYSTAELATRAQTINGLCTSICHALFSSGVTALLSLIYVIQIFHMTPKLAVPSLTVILVMSLFIAIAVWLQMGVTEKQLRYNSVQHGILYSYITNIEKIKTAAMEKRVFSTWLNAYRKSAEPQYNPPKLLVLRPVFTAGIPLLGTLWFYQIAVSSHITPSSFMGFQASFGLLLAAFTQLFDVVQNIAMIRPILNNVKPILDAVPELTDNKKNVGTLTGAITLTGVSFHYGDSGVQVLKDLNLSIRSGEYVAIVGRSGCGKSTLMRLLIGFEKPQTGTVCYDGYDIRSVNIQSLRRRIGCVMQNDRLFPGNILSNIAISCPGLTEEEAWQAAETAGIADDIRAMPMGMHTLISEGSSCISGGQRQRLIIARAVASKPKILLMDEATSALDNLTQKAVSEALDKLNVTRIVIAHRLSTVRNCSRILVLDEGRIAESGTYDELIAKNGLFAELIRFQQS